MAVAGGCSPAALLDVIVPDAGYVVRDGIAYGPEPRQRLDIYMPVEQGGAKDPSADDPAPVLVFFYGGSWDSGSRDLYRFVGEAFATRGYVVVIPDYRLYPEVRFPAFVRDGALALRWVTDSVAAYGGDPDSLALMGHSAGAHLAALLLLDERFLAAAEVDRSAIRAFVGYAGPYAFDPSAYDSTRPIFATAADPDQARPITFADGDACPMLLLHGGEDETVQPVNSRRLADKVEAAGGQARYVEIPDRGHIGLVLSLAAPFRGRDEAYALTLAFLQRELPSEERAERNPPGE